MSSSKLASCFAALLLFFASLAAAGWGAGRPASVGADPTSAALPAEVEKLAAEIAANPEALPVAMPMPTLPPGALGKPTHGKPAGKSAAAAAKPRSTGRHASRIAPSTTPSAPKQKHDGG